MMREQASKELVRDLFQFRELTRIPFIPWVCRFAAQLEQIKVREMLSDPGLLSRSLLNAQKLFDYDAIVNVFDSSLEAEACGCKINWGQDGTLPEVASHPLSQGASVDDLDISNLEKQGRLPAVLEATKRLNIIKGKEVAIIAVLTGPLTLARHLKGDSLVADLNQGSEAATKAVSAAGNILLKLCRSYCELGVDAVAIAEEMLGQLPPERCPMISGVLRSAGNITGFYGVALLILTRGCHEGHIEPVFDLPADGMAIAGDIDYRQVREAAQSRNRCYAVAIPESTLLGPLSKMDRAAREGLSLNGKGGFLTTEWEVPYATNVGNMHEVMKVIRGN